MSMHNAKLKKNLLPLLFALLFFALFFAAGLRIYDDFGPVSEERNQIDAGHIIWAEITGDHSHYPDLPPLQSYMNRYYGQGATFITVLAEAVFGFTWDINRVWKVRRLWNFFCFFLAVICLFTIVRRRYKRWAPAFLAAANLILLPRMFPEVFYNDRDPLFLTWMIFSFSAMLLFLRKTGFLTSLLFGAALAFTVNVRLFGLMFVIPLLLVFFQYPEKRRYLAVVLVCFLLFWYGMSPIAWKDPLGVIWTSISHLTTKQRMIDTQGIAEILFAGKFYPEQALPWFYLPLWMLISTPLVLLGLFIFGLVCRFRERGTFDADGYTLMDRSLAAFFILFIIGIPIIRPTLYSGWRHFYFLNLSLVWFAVYGLDRIMSFSNRPVKACLLMIEAASLILTLGWVITAHPYEGIYYSPVFRRAAGDFERDTGYTSTLECLEFLAENSADEKIEVMNANAYIHFSLIGLPEPVRERFSTIDWKIQRTPMKYVIFNYNNRQGNEMSFPYYAPVYSVERNGTKLAEVFQRTNNRLLDPALCVESIHASVNDEESERVLSDDRELIWSGGEAHDPRESITIALKDGTAVESLEVFPGDSADASESLRFFTSADGGTNWREAEARKNGTNGWLFTDPPEKYLRIESDVLSEQPWQVRQVLLYGSMNE